MAGKDFFKFQDAGSSPVDTSKMRLSSNGRKPPFQGGRCGFESRQSYKNWDGLW